ncbi:hypothetical protein O4J55_04315 [Paracoccus sp. PXZ]|uniref:hypothetical protein n=1 Tax=Paracoccus sp. MKU1 TaxID=1745182 RepID=UPI0007192B70|nr:hypothetical protein [Paracoccus sp. MKU1]KRW95563.1 hypothetical protein AQY21_13765 [Paracoccus sp. MKU1]
MKKILLILIPLLAFLGGAVGGDMLGKEKPSEPAGQDADAATKADHDPSTAPDPEKGADGGGSGKAEASETDLDWFRFPNQFFVPILRNGTSSAVMILSLSVEMPASARADIEAQEHRLRDALLNALLIEANTGAFDGNFTAEPTLQRLRASLLAAGQKAAGPAVKRILIEDIGRQIQ